LCQRRRLVQQSVLKVLWELLRVVVHQAIAKGCNEVVAGVMRADDPLAHC